LASAHWRGDFALYDCFRPYTMVGAGDFRMLVYMLPRAVLGLEPEQGARMTATRIRGVAWAVAPFLERLAHLAIQGAGHPTRRLWAWPISPRSAKLRGISR
jgi:hypothetical protein